MRARKQKNARPPEMQVFVYDMKENFERASVGDRGVQRAAR
jgi:hypothetical protein